MKTDRSIAMIVNPKAGRGRGLWIASAVAGDLRARGVRIAVRETSGPGDAERLTRELSLADDRRPDCIAGCGGDGTVQEIAHALASLAGSLGDARPAMGLVPTGRCNDLARVVGVSSDPPVIADVLANGRVRAVDLGCANGRHFCTVATVGVDAEVSSYVDAMRSPLSGTLAYVFGALHVLSRYRPVELRITGDFGPIEGPVFLASTANTSSYGGAIRIAPDAVPTDGQLDLCVIGSVSRPRALAMLVTVLAGRHRSRREVRFIRTRQLTIDSNESLELWADGERIARTPTDIKVVPGAIRVVVPRSSNLAKSPTACGEVR